MNRQRRPGFTEFFAMGFLSRVLVGRNLRPGAVDRQQMLIESSFHFPLAFFHGSFAPLPIRQIQGNERQESRESAAHQVGRHFRPQLVADGESNEETTENENRGRTQQRAMVAGFVGRHL